MYGHAHLLADLCHDRPRVFLAADGSAVCGPCAMAALRDEVSA